MEGWRRGAGEEIQCGGFQGPQYKDVSCQPGSGTLEQLATKGD